MNRRTDLDGVRVPLRKAFCGRHSPVGGPVIGDPEDPVGRVVWFLGHNEVHQAMKSLDTGSGFARAEDLGATDIPGGHICPCAHALIFKFDPAHSAWGGWSATGYAVTGLNAGFFIGTNDEIIWSQGCAFPHTLVQVEDATGLGGEQRITRKNPAPVRPWPDGVGREPPPHGVSADGGCDAPFDSLSSDVGAAQPRERNIPFSRDFTCQRLYLNCDFRGEKCAGDRALAVPRGRPSVPRRSAYAISRRFGAARGVGGRFACW